METKDLSTIIVASSFPSWYSPFPKSLWAMKLWRWSLLQNPQLNCDEDLAEHFRRWPLANCWNEQLQKMRKTRRKRVSLECNWKGIKLQWKRERKITIRAGRVQRHWECFIHRHKSSQMRCTSDLCSHLIKKIKGKWERLAAENPIIRGGSKGRGFSRSSLTNHRKSPENSGNLVAGESNYILPAQKWIQKCTPHLPAPKSSKAAQYLFSLWEQLQTTTLIPWRYSSS